MTEAEIGGKTWQVGQHIIWVAPNGHKAIRHIEAFSTNHRTGELIGVLDNRVTFGESDVTNRFVEACRTYGKQG